MDWYTRLWVLNFIKRPTRLSFIGFGFQSYQFQHFQTWKIMLRYVERVESMHEWQVQMWHAKFKCARRSNCDIVFWLPACIRWFRTLDWEQMSFVTARSGDSCRFRNCRHAFWKTIVQNANSIWFNSSTLVKDSMIGMIRMTCNKYFTVHMQTQQMWFSNNLNNHRTPNTPTCPLSGMGFPALPTLEVEKRLVPAPKVYSRAAKTTWI